MLWRAFLFIFGAECISQGKPILKPRLNAVPENSSLELTCDVREVAKMSQWGSTLRKHGTYSHLIFVEEGECTTTGFLNDDKYFETKCFSNGTFIVKIKHVNISNHGQQWYCNNDFATSNTAYINVKVPVKYVKIKNSLGDVFYTVEKKKTILTCETSEGWPSANITWTKISRNGIKTDLTHNSGYNISRKEILTKRNLTIVKSSNDIELVRYDNGTRIICEATNGILNANKEITMYVQYPPSKPVFVIDESVVNGSLRVISGNNLSVVCNSDSDPYPSYTWMSYGSNYSGQNLILTKLNRSDTLICTATNTMTLPNKTEVFGNKSAKLTLHVLYPSTKPVLSWTEGNHSLNKTLYAIRNDNITLSCYSDGDPAPKYQWLGQNQGALLYIPSIQMNTNITCIASNEMHDTFGSVTQSSSNTTVAIVVSSSPANPYLKFATLNELAKAGTYLTNKVIVEESSSFIVTCKADGYPSPTCSWNVQSAFKSPNLTFINISKDVIGVYKCFAENLIKRSFPPSENRTNTSTDLEIDVLYRSEIVMFNIKELGKKGDVFEVTVNKNIVFNCSADSNPKSSITLSFEGKELAHDVFAKTLIHTHKVTSCLDNGKYKCAAQNSYNKNPSFMEIELLVKCTPLRSPEFDLQRVISAAPNLTVTFEFKAIANPLPMFYWFKLNDSIWKYLKTSTKYEMHTSGLYSNFSVRSITEDDYGDYKLKIQNEVGFIEQLYILLKENVSQSTLYFTLFEKELERNKFIVNKSEKITFMCYFDPKILSDIIIRKQEGEHTVMTKNFTLRHTIHQVSCDDSGVYICSARNILATHEIISKLILIVKCPPKPSAKIKEGSIFFSALHSDVILQMGMKKYYDESNNTVFIWYKNNSILQHDGSKYIITSHGFQTNLIIRRINMSDFGQYRVVVRNSYGEYYHFFDLQEKETTKEQEPEGPSIDRMMLVAVSALCFIILTTGLAFFGIRHCRRKQNNRRVNDDNLEVFQLEVNQATSSCDANTTYYAEIEEIDDLYAEVNEPVSDETVYLEMRSNKSEEDATKYYITPTI